MAKRTVHRMEQERVVEEALKGQSLTIQGVADDVGLNYYTVRRVIEELVAKRRVRLDGTQDKARLYTYNGDRIDEHEYIPRISTQAGKHKATVLLKFFSNKPYDNEFVDAIIKLPVFIAHLLKFANHAHNGHDVKEALNALHQDMMDKHATLQRYADIYLEICEDPTWWYSGSLAELVRDKEYKLGEAEKVITNFNQLAALKEPDPYE